MKGSSQTANPERLIAPSRFKGAGRKTRGDAESELLQAPLAKKAASIIQCTRRQKRIQLTNSNITFNASRRDASYNHFLYNIETVEVTLQAKVIECGKVSLYCSFDIGDFPIEHGPNSLDHRDRFAVEVLRVQDRWKDDFRHYQRSLATARL